MNEIMQIWDFFIENEAMRGTVESFFDKLMPLQISLKQKEQKLIAENVHQLFRKWYYSVCVEDTPITPANVINTIVERKFKKSFMIIPATRSAYTSSGKKFKEYEHFIGITAPNIHYVTNDLESLLDIADPDIGINEELMLTEEERERLKGRIFVYSSHYIDFLTELAWELGLLRKMPAIGVKRAMNSQKAGAFLALKDEEKLRKIIDAAIAVCSKKMSHELPYANQSFSEKGIRELLSNPVSNDDIFEKIFKPLGIDVTGFISSLQEFPMEEADENIMMAVYSLGIVLDMYFYTPFGFYLHLIQPLYSIPYDFEAEIADLIECVKGKGDIETALFAPCTGYDLTVLGEKMLLNGKKPERVQKIPKNISEEELFMAVIADGFPDASGEDRLEAPE